MGMVFAVSCHVACNVSTRMNKEHPVNTAYLPGNNILKPITNPWYMAASFSRIPGYHLSELLYDGSKTLVYRGLREIDQRHVVIKLLKNPYPNFRELVQFRNQYTIAKNLELPGIIRPYCLEPYQNAYALVMEDFGGMSLGEYTRTHPLELWQFLAIAIQLADILAGLHRGRVIHKDLNPTNIVINPDTREVRLIDFSIASLLPRETQEIHNPNVLEGTLAYVSPEQTGRMNRSIDYRTDFYSLGVTFYELLTGQLPFQVDDPMELVHCHIAQCPPSIHDLNPAIPPVLSRIVEKLMAKNAEDRYQSALGLKHDLERCLDKWKETGLIEAFEIGQRDISDRFAIPEKLYGRELEVETLLNAFERVSLGATELMLVAGFSGIGKTAVVNEVHKPIVRQQGYFIKGKFDQFQRNIPLSAFVQAFQDLMGQLLSQSDVQLAQWKTKILDALSENAQVIIEVIPELERIIGKQQNVPELSGSASQNRFNLLFQKFIQVFTTLDHPLVLFVDDLQWADSASLKLMQLLLSEAQTSYLLLIGAYRDNEVFPAHPLMLTLNDLEKNQVILNPITLAPLNETHLNQLIADTFSCATKMALPLTQLVYQKTKGNPFFSNQFLKALHDDGLITFDFECGYWQCDIAQVKAKALTDDVVEFMALQLQKLPPCTQIMLKLAACIGNKFDLGTLAVVSEQSQTETAANLWKALQEGLVLPTSEMYKFFQSGNDAAEEKLVVNYRFLHDRVQQAAYSLIPDHQKQLTHLKIGQLLLNATSETERDQKIFEIVQQLNQGAEFLTSPAERDELAGLNLVAGQKARASTAYTAAIEYALKGINLLTTDCWQQCYQLTLALHELAAEVAYLSGDFTQMEQLIDTVLQNAQTLADQLKVYEIKVLGLKAQNHLTEALDFGLEVLAKLGIELPAHPSQEEIALGLEKTKSALEGRSIQGLIDLPVLRDPVQRGVTRILWNLCPPAYVTRPNLMILLTFKQIELALQYGNAPAHTHAYASYGLILCCSVGDIESGYEFGQLAINLVVRLEAKDLESAALFVAAYFTFAGKVHAKKALTALQKAYTIGLETGDLEHAALAAQRYSYVACLSGACSLIDLEQEMANYSHAMNQLKQFSILDLHKIYRQIVSNLLGNVDDPCRLVSEIYDEEEARSQYIEAGNQTSLCYLYVNKLILYYLFGQYHQANEISTEAKIYADETMSPFITPAFHFYDSLAGLAVYRGASALEQELLLNKIEANQENLQKLASLAPMNYLHKFYLVEAEKHRIFGQRSQALDLYDRAIAGAKEHEYLNEEALANELAAKFYLEWGKEKIAQVYMTEAYYCYAQWGAKAKTDHLETLYPQLLRLILPQKPLNLNSLETIPTVAKPAGTIDQWTQTSTFSSISISEGWDFATILKVSQSLSSEIHLDKLLTTLLKAAITNAGASKCVLILSWDNDLRVEAVAQLGQEAKVLPARSIHDSSDVPVSLIYTVKRSLETVVIADARREAGLLADSYIIQQQPQSLLCTPIVNQGNLVGILYLENNVTTGAFTGDRLEVLNLFCTQAAISLENARLYQKAQISLQKLELSLQELQQAQTQLVQSEKMSSLGNLVAGVAHEINNPLGFLTGSLDNIEDYMTDLLNYVQCVQQHHPQLAPAVTKYAQDIDLEFLTKDLPKLVTSMKGATERLGDISTSLRTFSRADTSEKVPCNLHNGIDSTLLILKYRIKANEHRPEIKVIKAYGELPLVKCFLGQLNQVFMNILANAIDAIDEESQKYSFDELKANPKLLTIQTSVLQPENTAVIRIKDNGPGMSHTVKVKVFDHLFTTKGIGRGTGLGLAIARQIVESAHGGKLICHSTLGEGTEFVIELPLG